MSPASDLDIDYAAKYKVMCIHVEPLQIWHDVLRLLCIVGTYDPTFWRENLLTKTKAIIYGS